MPNAQRNNNPLQEDLLEEVIRNEVDGDDIGDLLDLMGRNPIDIGRAAEVLDLDDNLNHPGIEMLPVDAPQEVGARIDELNAGFVWGADRMPPAFFNAGQRIVANPLGDEGVIRGEDILRRLQNDVNERLGARPRRQGHRVIAEDGVEIPANAIAEPQRFKVMPERPVARKISKPDLKKKVYPEGGIMYLGFKLSRKPVGVEDEYLHMYGYVSCIKKYPDLEFIEKEKPIDDNEECIVLMSELADHYAIQECKDCVPEFDLKEHNKEYQIAYKKHLKVISGHKRNKNG